MSVAALRLAAALVCGVGPISARKRAGLVVCRDASDTGRHCPTDPFAVASALDVLAVCLGAGMGVANAAAATAPSAPPVLRTVLQRAADLLALGADPETAWSVNGDAADLEALMRLARRSASSGSALARVRQTCRPRVGDRNLPRLVRRQVSANNPDRRLARIGPFG